MSEIGNDRFVGDELRPTVEQTIEAAYEAHSRALYGQLLALTREPATAEDLCQEAFLRLTREAQAERLPDNIGG